MPGKGITVKLGDSSAQSMPVGFKIPYTVMETDAQGNPDPAGAGDVVNVSVDDLALGGVAPDPTPTVSGALGTGFILGNAVGTLTVTFTASHSDGSPVGPPDVNVINILQGPAVATVVTFGVPIPQ